MRIAQLLMLAAVVLAPAHAQEKDRAFYKVEFTIRDGAAPGASVRRYMLLLDSEGKGSLRAGSRVPILTGSASQQYQYFDVGVNIDCRVREAGPKFAMSSDLDLSTVNPPEKGVTSGPNPTIGSVRISASAVVEPGKTTHVAEIDDPATQRRLTVDAVVTKAE